MLIAKTKYRRFSSIYCLLSCLFTLHFSSGEIHQSHEGIFVGKEPNEALFNNLRDLGIKAIISVDGKTPNTPKANEIGAQYVHLPIGYDGIEDERATQLAYAFQTLPRPIYIHCHHGIHRGPTAMVYALISTGEISPQKGLKTLEKLGTSPEYKGLWQAVRTAQKLDFIPPTLLPETSPVSDLASFMVSIDEYYHQLKTLNKNDWSSISSNPDIDSTHSALLLYEAYKELNRARLNEITTNTELLNYFQKSEEKAKRFHDALQKSLSAEETTQLFQSIKKDCRSCHQKYRN